MSADRDELRRLVDELPEEQVLVALAEVRQRLASTAQPPWPPAWFGAGQAKRPDVAERAEEILDEGFGRPT
jgi:hypothetical protein